MESAIRNTVRLGVAGDQRMVCPWCGPERKKKTEQTLSVKVDGDKIIYNCWHCERTGLVPLGESMPKPKPKSKGVVMAIAKPMETMELTDNATAWLASRGISGSTATALNVKSVRAWTQTLQRESDCLAFPYTNKGKVYAAKIRSTEGKAFSSNGAPQTFFNAENVDDWETIIICEGEMDVLAFHEAGITNAVSIPLGAVNKVSDAGVDPMDDGKFSFLWRAEEQLNKAKKIIIATDADGPGQATAEEIARRVGKDRCWRVDWPDGCKDANDVLIQAGAGVLRDLPGKATPWPVAGLYEANHFIDKVKHIYANGLKMGESTGYQCLDRIYTVMPGQVTVVTGHPGSGKSEVVDQIMINLAADKGWRFGICSFENPPEIHITKLLQKVIGKPFADGVYPRMTEKELQAGSDFVHMHFSFLHQTDGSLSTLDSIIERLKVAVLRHGIRGAVIDPYNYISKSKDASETDWISDMLSRVKAFAMAHDIHIWFVAHPTKMQRNADGDVPPPLGYDISGCYDDETEVLTSNGWMMHCDVSLKDKVATFNPETGEIVYDFPQHVHEYDHDGPMHCWRGDNLDMVVTPNHRMVAKRKPESSYEFVMSKDITPGRWYFPSSGKVKDVPDRSDIDIDLGYNRNDLMWFMGFWVAEGCVQSNSLSVCQAADNHHVPKEIMDRLGLTYTDKISSGRAHEKHMWVARLIRRWHIDLIDTVITECGSGAANKMVPSMLWAMDREAKMAFLDGYWFGDGSTRSNSRQAYTISSQLADDIMRLTIETGHFTAMRKDYSDNEGWADRYVVTWRDQEYRSIQTDRNLSIEEYSGKVYCLTVPSGAYITRRNGKVSYQGNSAAWFAKADMGMTVHRPDRKFSNMTEVIIWKVRFNWLGREGSTELLFRPECGIYEDVSAPISAAPIVATK